MALLPMASADFLSTARCPPVMPALSDDQSGNRGGTGVAADADVEDMSRAIDAARRAFDETDWSRKTELRVRVFVSCARRCSSTSRSCAT